MTEEEKELVEEENGQDDIQEEKIEEVEELSDTEEQVANLAEELAQAKEGEEKNIARLKRLQADFSNYRKRVTKEKKQIATQTLKNFALDLIPVIDNFERALKAEDNVDDFYKGVEMIYNQLLKTFADEGIEEILAEGEEFNPEYHEAIMRVESDEYEEGTVVEVVQKGFILDDRVIRPAMVKVAG